MNSHMYIDDVGRQGSELAGRIVTRMNPAQSLDGVQNGKWLPLVMSSRHASRL